MEDPRLQEKIKIQNKYGTNTDTNIKRKYGKHTDPYTNKEQI